MMGCENLSLIDTPDSGQGQAGVVANPAAPVTPAPTSTIADDGLAPESYRLRPGDIVAVSVWQEPGLEQLVLVRPDGGISFPLAGDLNAAGLTVRDLSAALKERLKKYISDPVVTVTLQEIPGNRIYVIGRVNKPGDFPLVTRGVTVMQALAMAGGLTPFADESKIKVLRKVAGTERSIPFDYKKVRRGQSLEQNIALQAGDVIVVP
ncbi:polysaccharide biosynthesis/export family protein [Thiorhodococcus minor]|nr:polysaccharide biosynthesis/export family protein [Thiorhodococcus minor]